MRVAAWTIEATVVASANAVGPAALCAGGG
jgi:hypothetical protein